MTIEYHLKELEISQNKNNIRMAMPEILPSDEFILDIGCGIGQLFISLNCTDRTCIGIDVDEDAISYGIKSYGKKIQFILSDAAKIPLPSNILDIVCCRVSIPYTNIPKVIKQIQRTLKIGGRVWILPHSKEFTKNSIMEAVKSKNIKSTIYQAYSLINGYCFKYFGFVFPFINGKYESWQDIDALKRLLVRNGFEVKLSNVHEHTVIEGFLLEK